jgi:TRAP transporter TAXI family solute receptor
MVFSISSSARIVTIVTDPMDSGTYGATAGIARIINKYNTANLNIKVKPTTGSTEIAGLLATGEGQLGVHNNFDAQLSWLTKGLEFQVYDKIAKVTPLRLLFGGAMTYFSTLTVGGRGIETGADLKGKRYVGGFTSQPQDEASSEAFLAGWGLTRDDVIWVEVSGIGDGITELLEGTVDAIGDTGPGGADMRELLAMKDCYFLSINTTPEGLKAFEDIYGYHASVVTVNPSPLLPGVVKPTAMLKTEDYYMCRGDQISDEEAYAIVESIWNHIDEVREIDPDLQTLASPEMLITPGFEVPYHPGAIKFYTEKGIWTQDFEDRQAELLALEAEEMK